MARNEAMCPYCGEMISDKATVCKYCGRMLRCDCDVHDSGGDGWRPAPAEDKRTGPSAERARRRNRGKLWGCLLTVILVTIAMIGLTTALMYFFVRDHSDSFEDFWSELVESGDVDIDDLDLFNAGNVTLEDPIADLACLYVGAFTTDDHDAMAELYVPEIRAFYEGETDEMLTDLDEWFDSYGKEIDRFVPLGQDELSLDDLADAAEALNVTFDRAVDAQMELLFKNGDDLFVDLVVVEMDGSWYLYSAF